MKKLIALTLVAASLSAITASAQGFLQLNSVRSQVYNGIGSAASVTTGTALDVALFWAAGGGVANPFATYGANSSITGNNTTTEAQAGWTDAQFASALNGSSFAIATDASNGNASTIVNATTKGAVAYLAGAGWSINGAAGGSTITLLELGWDKTYATPAAAAAAGGAVGWSYLSSYALATSATDPTISQPAFASFGVFAPAGTIPEPGTMALAALGGASLLLFRRKK